MRSPVPVAKPFKHHLSGPCLLLKQIPGNWARGSGEGLDRALSPQTCAREGSRASAGGTQHRRILQMPEDMEAQERQAQDEAFSLNGIKIIVPHPDKCGHWIGNLEKAKVIKHLPLQKEFIYM